MQNRYFLDNSTNFSNEKIAKRCFNYCIREFVLDSLFDFEKECIENCNQKIKSSMIYFKDESLQVFAKKN